MKKSKNLYPWIGGLLFIVLLLGILCFHFFNYKHIMTKQFSTQWSTPLQVATLTPDDRVMSYLDGTSIVRVQLDEAGHLTLFKNNLSFTESEERKLEIQPFDRKSLKSVRYLEHKLYYIFEEQLFAFDLLSAKSSAIKEKVLDFSIQETKKENLLLLSDGEEISFFSLPIGENPLFQAPLQGPLKAVDVAYFEEGYVMAYLDETSEVVEKSLWTKNLSKQTPPQKITSLNVNLGYLENIHLFSLQQKPFLTFTKYTGKQGVYQTFIFVNRLNAASFSLEDAFEIKTSSLQIAQIDNAIWARPQDEIIEIYGIGRNKQNYLQPDGADIFKITWSPSDQSAKSEFISTAAEPCISFSLFSQKGENYLLSRHIHTSKIHQLKWNGTAETLLKDPRPRGLYTADGLMAAFSGLIYGLIMMFPRLLYMVLFFSPLALILFLLDKFKILTQDKVICLICILFYVAINLWTMDFFLGGIGRIFMPDWLIGSPVRYLMPLCINILSLTIVYLLSRYYKKPNYMLYTALFVLMDIFFLSQLYLPFSMLLAK